jgi:hypothetical protein
MVDGVDGSTVATADVVLVSGTAESRVIALSPLKATPQAYSLVV